MDYRNVSTYRIDWIVSFVAVAQHGGFSAAAKALFRSQPRVSSHVADLEHALGTRLFDRSVHPAALTPEGRALLPHAEAVLQRLDVLADVTAGATGAVRGEVRMGAYPSAAAYLFPLAVRRLRRTHPHVSLVLHEGPSLELGAALGAGEVDLVLRPVMPLVGDNRLVSALLWREPLVAVLAAEHPLAGSRALRMHQLAALPLVTIGESTRDSTRQYETNVAFAAAGLHPTIAFQTNQPQTLVSMVRHGLGAGVTNCLAMTTANLDGVSLVPLADASCDRQVAVWWRADQPRSVAVEAVRDACLALPPPRWPWGEERAVRPA